MWLSRKFGSRQKESAETGTVAIGGSSTIKTASTVLAENVQNYAPYGYSAFAPCGEEILLISSANGNAGAGTKMSDESINEGEISISSKGGARIVLKNDGSIQINGFVFTADGKIKNAEGQVVL